MKINIQSIKNFTFPAYHKIKSVSKLFWKQKLYTLAVALLSFSAVAQDPVTITATSGTIGPVTYPTLKSAFDAINTGVHQGGINIGIIGNTTETATAVLNASGSGAANY